jgi:hypothetical protein
MAVIPGNGINAALLVPAGVGSGYQFDSFATDTERERVSFDPPATLSGTRWKRETLAINEAS